MLMKSVVFLTVLATTLAGNVPYQNIEAFERGSSRIVGGTTAAAGQFPYQALVRTTGDSYAFCGGTIVSDRWIITAGHFTSGLAPDAVIVSVGKQQLNSGGYFMGVKKLVLHPNFNITLYVNDISLVNTKNPIEFSPTVQPIGIGSTAKIGGNVAATISGWGYTSPGGGVADSLQFLNVNTLTTNDCRAKVPEPAVVHANTICALGATGSGICSGDYGGPLVANGQLIGISSVRFNCAAGFPDIYVRISSHYDWIIKKIAT